MNNEELEAQRFLDSLEPQVNWELSNSTNSPLIYIDEDDKMKKENQSIIDGANSMMLERLKHNDSSLRIQDINAMKSEAFKQNQILDGNSEEYDNSKLIPTNVFIQINNN